jgi:hypothetical protein
MIMAEDTRRQRKRERKRRRRALQRFHVRRVAAARQAVSPTRTNKTGGNDERKRREAKTEKKESRKKKKVTASDISGLKYFERIGPLLESLHAEGCQRDIANNRELFYDNLCMLMLMAMFNPMVDSLRALEQASELEKVQKRLKCSRASLGSLSEAARVFDAALLKPIIEQLGRQLEPLARDPRLGQLTEAGKALTLVDGSLLSALPRISEAVFLKRQNGSGLVKWRLHAHFEVDRFVPTRIDVRKHGGGENDERSVMETAVESDHCYVMDRGYYKFTLFNKIHAADSSYVCRIRDNGSYQVTKERSLTDADREAAVISDQTVQFGAGSKEDARPDHTMRLVIIKTTPHEKRGKYKGGSTGPGSDGYLRIATNLLDVPAEIIALLYQYRWEVEIFFRFFKQLLGCRHLFFHSANGIEIQAYCAIIACMLISLWTGRKPTKRTYEMVCYYFLGLASEAELIRHLRKLKVRDSQKDKA